MKRALGCLLTAALMLLSLSGCALIKENPPLEYPSEDNFTSSLGLGESEEPRDFKRAVWVSYLDLAGVITADAQSFESALERMMGELKSIETTDIFLQVRAFGEALYVSDLFPSAVALYGDYDAQTDYLASFAAAARANGMRLHAWINPYRLGDISSEPYAALAQRLKEADERAVVTLESGSFINPASEKARELIVADIAAMCAAYDIEGVQFDDYFYPSAETSLDEEEYAAYLEGGGSLALDDWRRENVSELIRQTHDAVHASGEGRVFGVSPDASIERNRSVHFADVERWCTEDGYLDYICPQIYYGYENETRPFTAVVEEWKALGGERELIVGVSAYKTGLEDKYAGSGALEWRESFDIIARQYSDARGDAAVSGVAFFRYGSLFAPDESVEAFAELELYALKREIEGDV